MMAVAIMPAPTKPNLIFLSFEAAFRADFSLSCRCPPVAAVMRRLDLGRQRADGSLVYDREATCIRLAAAGIIAQSLR